MIIVIDMGNSAVTFGKFENNKISSVWSLPVAGLKNTVAFGKGLLAALRKNRIDKCRVKEIAFCSVVPQKNKFLLRILKNVFSGSRVYNIGDEIQIPLKNKYKYPQHAGYDRLLNSLGAIVFYRAPAIIVDFGTAITIDVVSANKEFLGGVIVPGISLLLKSLRQNTALLPLVEPKKPSQMLGKDTKSAMLSGVFYGIGFLVDGFIDNFKKRFKRRCIVIGTGGNVDIIKPYC